MEIHRTIAPDFVRIVVRMPTRAEFDGAARPCRVWFLSADNPDSICGFGFRGIVLDEAAAVPASVWTGATWELSRNRVPVPEGFYIWDAGEPAPGGK
jgi:hypothetical protein